MYRIDDPSASPTLPTPEAALTEGYWTEGNPGTGTPATLERASWFNMVQEELRAIPVAAGIVPSKTVYNQILTALRSMFSSVVSTTRNLIIDIPTASASATVTADEIVVESALGGQTYRLASFNKTLNISTVGVGGMDVTGLPATSAVAIYAIYNPTTGASAVIGFNASSVKPTEVYSGTAMPAGYTASALVGLLLVSLSQFNIAYCQDRHVTINQTNQIAGSAPVGITAQGIGVPFGAKSADLNVNFSNTTATNASVTMGSNSAMGLSGTSFQVNGQSGSMYKTMRLRTPQTIWYSVSNSTGTATYIFALTGYDF